jgi:prepilin-type N-terminal cleavage/methylation domain-containing protein
MYSSRRAVPPRPRSVSGFTLVEVLVALVIGSLISITIMAVVSQQGRLARVQGAREEVQQNTRGAVELLASELRSLPREGLVLAGANRIVLRVPRTVGLLCTAPVPSSGSIHVLVPARSWSRTAADTLSLAARFASEPPTSESSEEPSDPTEVTPYEPEYATMNQMQVTTSATVSSPCNSFNASGELRMLTLTPVPSSTSYSTQMRAAIGASDVYLYDQVEYTIGTSAVPGLWINRISRGSTRPLAGPLPPSEATRLLFRSFTSDGKVTGLPVTDVTTLAAVLRIEVEVVIANREGTMGAPGPGAASRRMSTEVFLRNTGGAL